MDLSTFSTGFSTEFVKKRASFPRCFPLFPPSFPLHHRLVFIREVFPGIFHGGFWGEMRKLFLFFQKKVAPFSFLFSPALPSCKVLSPRWNAGRPSFPHRMRRNFFVLKTVGKPDFSTEKERLHLRSPGRCSRSSSFLTSYSGTRSARSGSTGSGCTHRRWW